MTARNHHYVPQCYLKGFVNDRRQPKLFVADRSGKTFITAPKNVASKRDFHRINADGIAPDAVESAFSVFETALSSALVRSISARYLDEDAKNCMINFIALISIKNPRHREMLRDVKERLTRATMSIALKKRERWERLLAQARRDGAMSSENNIDYEQMKDFIERGHYTIQVPQSAHLKMELKLHDQILQIIGRRNWTIDRANPDRTGFVTTDHPSVLTWSRSERRPYPPGLGHSGTALLFPVSNDLLMMGSFEADSISEDLNELQVAAVNSIFISHAERQVFARDNKFSYISGSSVKNGDELAVDPNFTK